MKSRAFTLVEVLLAVFILGIGIISVSALFPAGIAQQRSSNDDVLGPIVSQHALGVIRSKVSQDDFGTFEEYGLFDFDGSAPSTIAGDWAWKRPPIYFQERIEGVGLTDDPVENDAGVIDVFGTLMLNERLNCGEDVPETAFLLSLSKVASEFGNEGIPPDGDDPDQDGNPDEDKMFGIPANRLKWDPDRDVKTPLFVFDLNNNNARDFGEARQPVALISQQERWWPRAPAPPVDQNDTFSGGPADAAAYLGYRPQFVWDCMFRRFQGRILVAIFVYRTGSSGGAADAYRAVQGTTASGGTDRPNMPRLGVFGVASPPAGAIALVGTAPRASGRDNNVSTLADNATIPGTDPGFPAGFNVSLDLYAWQAPGQWWLDQWNDIHRVASGRRTIADGPLTLSRPVTFKPSSAALFGLTQDPVTDALILGSDPGTLPAIWFLPTEVGDTPITPVFVTVMEL